MIFTFLVLVTWLFSGLLINVLQLITYVTIRPFNLGLYRSIIGFLNWSSFGQLVLLLEWYAGSKIRINFADAISESKFRNEDSIILANHSFGLDWVWVTYFLERLGLFGVTKLVVKNSLKYLPVLGFSWYLSGCLFLARDFKKDAEYMKKTLSMSQGTNIQFFLFPEGTRFSKDKLISSNRYAQENGLPKMKYHLQPKSRGLIQMLKHLSDNNNAVPTIYNMQMAYHDTLNQNVDISLKSVINGKKIVGDVYLERITIDHLDLSSDEAIKAKLIDIYQEKEKLMDHHATHGSFPGHRKPDSAHWGLLLNSTFWFTVVSYYIITLSLQSMTSFATISLLLSSMYAILRWSVYLHWSIHCQLVFLLEWCCGSKIRVNFADAISQSKFGHEDSVIVVNHTYTLDWLWVLYFLEQHGSLGLVKAVAKKSLQYIPVIGWNLYFSDCLFLARNWKRDAAYLKKSLSGLQDGGNQYVLFPEGTRFTKDKLISSNEYAEENHLPPMKYHLYPKSRGLAQIIRHLNENSGSRPTIYNLEIAFHETLNRNTEISLKSVFRGKAIVGDVYLERITLDKLDLSNDDEIKARLLDIYQQKEILMDHHVAHREFPGLQMSESTNWGPLFNFLFWVTFISWFLSSALKLIMVRIYGRNQSRHCLTLNLKYEMHSSNRPSDITAHGFHVTDRQSSYA
ncbi:1-acyl-sn-glycerol-3-phosphate acyltransferase delta [Halotydeus destructor]|nr:1-acyl-sn-glycerol-3-phosphate acyltransferase delta [Halotydeus destructor]